MTAKVKLLKKDFKFLSRDFEVDEAVMKELEKLRKDYQVKNKKRIDELKKQALQQVTALYKRLQKDHKEREKRYAGEMERLEGIIKELKKKKVR
jgi:rRNA-processing protein FCF1